MGSNVSGSIASSGKFRKACMSFSNGNFTCGKQKKKKKTILGSSSNVNVDAETI